MTRAARRLAVRGRPEAIPVVNIVSGRGMGGPRRTGQLVRLSDLVAISCDLVSARHAQSLLVLRGGHRVSFTTQAGSDVGELAGACMPAVDRPRVLRPRADLSPRPRSPCTVVRGRTEGALARVSLSCLL